jgi:hypothetical protein
MNSQKTDLHAEEPEKAKEDEMSQPEIPAPKKVEQFNGHPAWEFATRIFPWVLALSAFVYFHGELKSLAKSLDERIRLGAPIKVKGIEVGAIRIEQRHGFASVVGSFLDDNSRAREREAYYETHRRVMLVHTIARSRTKNGWYDITIFVIPHTHVEDKSKDMSTLAQVSRVEYYFGNHWDNQVFPSHNRASGFAVSVNAYGPFLATAKIIFNDGQSAMLERYIDFEMGDYAPVGALDPQEDKSDLR